MRQVSSSSEADIDCREKAVISTHAVVKEPHEISWHCHSRGQLLFSKSESIQVNINDSAWILAPEQSVWIPSHSHHQLMAKKGAEYYSVYTDQSLHSILPNTAGLVHLSRLDRELIYKSSEYGSHFQINSAESRFNQVLLDQLQGIEADNLQLIMPKSNVLKSLCEYLVNNPLDRVSLQAWGSREGRSERHLARCFKRETGITFSKWRHRLDILYMLDANRKGHSFTYIAADLDYANVSSLSKMVKKETGFSPSEMMSIKS